MIDIFDNVRYCYLNCIYTDSNDSSIFYELILSDSAFKRMRTVTVNLEQLKEIDKNKQIQRIIYDFSIDNGFLKCSNFVKRIPIGHIGNNLEDIDLFSENKSYTFYTFLEQAISNNYILLDDRIIDKDEWVGYDFCRFNKIKFAKTTMSVYCPIITSEGIYNKMLVVMEEGILKAMEFYFAVDNKEDKNLDKFQYIKDMKINNSVKSVFKFKVLPLYTDDIVISNPLINKCMSTSVKCSSIIALLDDYIKVCRSIINKDSEELAWIGGNNSYSSNYGVIFESTLKPLTTLTRANIVTFVINELYGKVKDKAEAIEKLSEYVETNKLNSLSLMCARVLCNVVYFEGGKTDLLSAAIDMRENYENILLHVSLYLYKVRTASYLEHIRMITEDLPVIAGSDEKAYTKVTEGFYYGQ